MKKYILVDNIPKVNELYEEGYRVHTHTVHTYHDDIGGRIMSKDQYLMSLQEPSKYDNVELYKKAPITYEAQAIEEGWRIIHHTSKEVILVREHDES